MRLFGVSFDSPEENADFARKLEAPLTLLSDTERTLSLAYRACESERDSYPRRVSYVVGRDGRVELAVDAADPSAHPRRILDFLRASP